MGACRTDTAARPRGCHRLAASAVFGRVTRAVAVTIDADADADVDAADVRWPESWPTYDPAPASLLPVPSIADTRPPAPEASPARPASCLRTIAYAAVA